MPLNVKKQITICLGLLLLATHSSSFLHAQSKSGKLGWLKKWGKNQLDSATGNIINRLFHKEPASSSSSPNTERNTENTDGGFKQKKGNTGRPKDSEIKETDFSESGQHPSCAPGSTRYKIANNLMVDVKGKYPPGYQPKWRFISYKSNLNMDAENWIAPQTGLHQASQPILLSAYNGKAVLRFGDLVGCDCYADIFIRDSSTVLTKTPQTFKVASFQKILNERATGEKCKGDYLSFGFEGSLTLSADDNGNILMDFMFERYRGEDQWAPYSVAWRYIAENISIENEMTADKANDIVQAEQEAKQRQKNYQVKIKKQTDSLLAVIAKKYDAASECKSCFYSSHNAYISSSTDDYYYVHSGNYAGSRTDYDLNTKIEIKNKCGYKIMFVGIQQLYDEEKGYYLKDVTKIMDAGYYYTSDQGIFSSLFTSLIGGGSEFSFSVQDSYHPEYASVNAVQWLKVVKAK